MSDSTTTSKADSWTLNGQSFACKNISVPIGNQGPLFLNHHECNTEDMNKVYICNIFLESGKLLVLWIFQNFKFLSFHVIDLFWLKCILIESNLCWVWSKACGLEVNADKTKYMIMSRDQNAGRSHSMKIDNRSIERVEKFKYLGTMLTNKNSIQEEIKSRLKVGNACCYSVQNLLSSSLLSKKLKIKIYSIEL